MLETTTQASKKRPRRVSATVGVVTLAGFVAACSSGPPSRYYTLNAASAPVVNASRVSVLVGPVSVPAIVDRPQIVVDIGANQVKLEEFDRWAAPLQNAIARVVADNLVSLLGTPRVTLSSQTLSADADFRASIDVQSFQSAPGEAATLDAVWTVRRVKDGKAETGRTNAREPVQEKTYDGLAAAHSRALARLSQDIAAAVRALAP